MFTLHAAIVFGCGLALLLPFTVWIGASNGILPAETEKIEAFSVAFKDFSIENLLFPGEKIVMHEFKILIHESHSPTSIIPFSFGTSFTSKV